MFNKYFDHGAQMLEENERSIHDALCVVRSLFKQRYGCRPLFGLRASRPATCRLPVHGDVMRTSATSSDADMYVWCRYLIPGGSAPEMEVSFRLMEYAKTLSGAESFCVRAFAEALEIVPATLAENAGLNPISIVTELRLKHARGEKYAGVNVRKVCCAFPHSTFQRIVPKVKMLMSTWHN
jgi:chaperonin GroEL (HSP60 family)